MLHSTGWESVSNVLGQPICPKTLLTTSQYYCVISERVKNSFTPWQKPEDYIFRLISSVCNLICTSGEIHEYTYFLSEIMCLDVTLYLFFLKISEI